MCRVSTLKNSLDVAFCFTSRGVGFPTCEVFSRLVKIAHLRLRDDKVRPSASTTVDRAALYISILRAPQLSTSANLLKSSDRKKNRRIPFARNAIRSAFLQPVAWRRFSNLRNRSCVGLPLWCRAIKESIGAYHGPERAGCVPRPDRGRDGSRAAWHALTHPNERSAIGWHALTEVTKGRAWQASLGAEARRPDHAGIQARRLCSPTVGILKK